MKLINIKALRALKPWKALGWLTTLMAMTALTSCSDTAEEPVVTPDTSGDTATLTLYIPNTEEYASRAGNVYADATEAKVNELWFCAYAQKGKGSDVVKKLDLQTPAIGYTSSNEYVGYDVILQKGDYHIYVLANVSAYGVTISPPTSTTTGTTETNLQNLVLNFGSLTSTGIASNNLPMACYYTEISDHKTENSKISEGVFTLDSPGQDIYADLTLLCAKVRYTVLFNMETFSSSFNKPDGVDYESIDALSVINKTYLNKDTSTPSTTNDIQSVITGIDFNRYVPTDSEITAYTGNSFSGGTTPPPVFVKSVTNFDQGMTHETKRAWQGIVYLPENKSTTNTKIRFNPAANSNIAIKDENDNPTGIFTMSELERGNFYDVVARLKTPEKIEYDVAVYVKVLPWVYNDFTANW